MEQVVCHHFQTGFCKFGEHCRKRHVQEICQTKQCKSKACIQRHPNVCKYFATQNTCKFGEKCAYQHKISKDKSEINELVARVGALENTIQVMSQKIKVLEDELQNEKKESDSQVKIFKCDHCNYNASTSTVLKRHTTLKHNGKDSRKERDHPEPENERGEEHDNSFELLVTDQERADALFCPPPPKDPYTNETFSSPQYNCELCKHECESEAALHGHMCLEHNCFIPHTSKWDKNKCHICNKLFTTFNQTLDFKCHMITVHGFKDNSNICMKCESTEVGLYRPMQNQALVMSCRDCEHI
jgi:hypothetical protein